LIVCPIQLVFNRGFAMSVLPKKALAKVQSYHGEEMRPALAALL
jgi:hypothetical protein